MPINQVRLTAKLNAILAMNASTITSRHIHIPTLGSNYTVQQLQAWLDKRSNLLNTSKTFSDAQLLVARTAVYNQLSTAGKLTADKIIAGTDYANDVISDADWEGIAAITLYQWITRP